MHIANANRYKSPRRFRGADWRLSKKWQSHFFEKDPLRSAPQLSADSGQLRRRTQRKVFSATHMSRQKTYNNDNAFASADAKLCEAFLTGKSPRRFRGADCKAIWET